jgi:hypothetical protein
MRSAALHATRFAIVTVTVVGLSALLSGRDQTPTAVLGKPFAYDPARPLEIRVIVSSRVRMSMLAVSGTSATATAHSGARSSRQSSVLLRRSSTWSRRSARLHGPT